MATGKGKGHELHPNVVKRLLDGLTNDEDFRNRFQADAQSALESIGYESPTEEGVTSAGSCLQLKAGATLASPEQIDASRSKLERSLSGIQGFLAPSDLIA